MGTGADESTSPPAFLLVDDRPESNELLALALARHFEKASVRSVTSGAACLEAVKEGRTDLVILDAKMPDLDGFETCRRLKRDPATAHLPVLMISGVLTDGENRLRGIEAGADGYLCKPFEYEELVAQVRVILRAHRAEEALRHRKRRLEDELRDAESRFRVLFEFSPDAVFVEGEDGTVLDVNQAACRLHGLPREQLRGRNVLDLVPQEERATVAMYYPRWFNGQIHEIEGYSYSADGRRIPVEIHANVVDYGGQRAAILQVRDISARRQAEEALRLSESRYRAIVEEQAEFVCRSSPDTTLTFVNGALIRYMQMPREHLIGRAFIDFLPESERAPLLSDIAGLSPSDPVMITEHRVVMPDGRTRWHQWSNRAMFDEKGAMVELQSVGRDVTERRDMETRQHTLLQGMRAIVELADELIAAPDENSLYRLAVELARERLGLERVGLLLNNDPWVQGTFGTDYEGRTTDERPKRIPMDKAWREAMRLRLPNEPRWSVNQEALYYWDGQRTTGDRRGWVAVTPIQTAHKSIGVLCNDTAIGGAPLDEGRQEVVAVYCSLLANIAERKAIETERAKLALAVEQSAESILITDTRGIIQYVNPGFERITGFKRTDALGKTPRILKSGKHVDAFYRRMWQALQRGEVWTGRMTNIRRDGTHYEVEHTISPVRDNRGQIVNFISVSQDVTATVQMESELRQAQKMESIGRLAGGIAHDFNNLLTAILGFARMISDEVGADSPVRGDLDEIISAGERASRLTKQLLAFGRKQVVQIQPLNLNDLVEKMSRILQRSLGEHIELVTRLKTELGVVEADPGQIEQILMNLAINAHDAMPRGGRLTIETGDAELDEDYCLNHVNLKPGAYVMLRVSDNGCGMPEHVRERAFEPFFTTKEKGKGSGLGLATVYGIVKQAHGHIVLNSSVNVGTTIAIYFPRSLAEESRPVIEQKPELRTGTETILVVEDEPIVRRLAVRNLQSLGYRVIEARNGEDALQVWSGRQQPIHLVLSDVVMPRIGGPELVERLHKLDPTLRFIFMSGFAEDMLSPGAARHASSPLLFKPFTREMLAHQVRLALDAPDIPEKI